MSASDQEGEEPRCGRNSDVRADRVGGQCT